MIKLYPVKLVENEIEVINNYKGFDITVTPIMNEKWDNNTLVNREISNVFHVYDSKTGYECFESISFKSLQNIIDYINV